MNTPKHVVVVGAGAAGLNVAGRLRRLAPELQVTILDPAAMHFYQPLWTFVGGGVFPRERSRRDMAELIPAGARWAQDAAVEFMPEQNLLVTQRGERIGYDLLVMAPGIQINWQTIPGLKEGLGKHGVCSNYSYDSVNSTWEQVQALRSGRAIFTFPTTPIKCAGAPLKVMFLAEDYWRRTGFRQQINIDRKSVV